MSTSSNPVASIVGQVAGAAASGAVAPAAGIVGVIGGLISKALDFIPDPKDKLALQQHGMDLQAQAAAQELDAVTKQVQASAAAQADAHLAKVRAVFCYSICAAVVFNLILVPLLHAICKLDIAPIMLPTNLLVIFATIMLGLVGVPQAFSALKDVMGMPGDSQVSVLGVKIGNKS
jgi:hypothetical protein